jgi:hypothetical protein
VGAEGGRHRSLRERREGQQALALESVRATLRRDGAAAAGERQQQRREE